MFQNKHRLKQLLPLYRILGRIRYAEEKGNTLMRLQERTKHSRTLTKQLRNREAPSVLKTVTWDE